MTERKKPGVTFESFVDRQIREAQENGAFDDLDGAGKPIPAGPRDELWWVRGYLQRENLSTDALLPESLQLRKEIERLPATLIEIRYEDSVRDTLTELNTRVVAWIRMPSPPLIPLGPVDVEDWVRQWRRNRAAAEEESRRLGEEDVAAATATSPPRRGSHRHRIWHRIRHRFRRGSRGGTRR